MDFDIWFSPPEHPCTTSIPEILEDLLTKWFWGSKWLEPPACVRNGVRGLQLPISWAFPTFNTPPKPTCPSPPCWSPLHLQWPRSSPESEPQSWVVAGRMWNDLWFESLPPKNDEEVEKPYHYPLSFVDGWMDGTTQKYVTPFPALVLPMQFEILHPVGCQTP